jgi:hypothetical protein
MKHFHTAYTQYDNYEDKYLCSFGLSAGAIAGIGSLAGGAISAGGSLAASNEAANASEEASATQQNMFNENVQNLGPYTGTGAAGLSALANIEGLPFPGYNNPVTGYSLPGTSAGTSSDIYGQTPFQPMSGGSILPGALAPGSIATSPLGTSGYPQPIQNALANFKGSPDYQFQLQQGNLATNQGLAATGQIGSGGQLRADQSFGQGLASTDYQNYFNNLMTGLNTSQNQYQNYFTNASNINSTNQSNYTNYFNRLASIAGIGQTASNTQAQLGQATGAGIASTQLAGGQAQAAGIQGATSSVTSGLNNYALYNYLNPGNSSNSAYNINSAPNFNGSGFGSQQDVTQNTQAYS